MQHESVIWHDVENGSYSADLPVWEMLARGQVLEVGCGTGRVALHLARAGQPGRVTGADHDAALVETLCDRATARGLDVRATVADAAALDLGMSFDSILLPMQLIQLLSSPSERIAALRSARRHLKPGGSVAVAIVEEIPIAPVGGPGLERPLPDVAEVEGWIYSSLPLELVQEGGRITVTRLRQLVSPAGDLTEATDRVELAALDAAGLTREASAAGLEVAGRERVSSTDSHVGSTVLVCEAAHA